MNKIITLEKYIKLTSVDIIKNICSEFFRKMDLHYLLYIRHYPNNDRLWLTTHGEWTKHYFEKGYQYISAFEFQSVQFPAGYYLWQTLPGQDVFNEARFHFDIDHGITVVHQLADSIEFTHLAARRSDYHITNNYLNNMNLINQFILSFRDQAKDLIAIAQANMLPSREILRLENSSHDGILEKFTKCNKTEHSIYGKKKMLSANYQNIHLTCREVECIELLKKGKTALDISLILNISKRTVESHIENIRKKLNCYNNFQLGYMISKIDNYRV